ncbi:hypothetical protein [Sphaerotilus sp.]|uniref:hypothetical protein n=1 Tax=Sphaerotilus sp. TaxID=2093942 RepID=UPI0025E70350|nr:hypothetical protein [Sphaerotilus sp.]
MDKLRSALRKKNSRLAGIDGEEYAGKWLKAYGIKYESIEQGKNTLSSELKMHGGKRPDFIAEFNGGFMLFDAKYHVTDNGTLFKLTDEEIGKYRALVSFCKNKSPGSEINVVFIVMPKEDNGSRIVLVDLDEFNNGEATTICSMPATSISLLNRDELWFDNID